MDVTQFSPCLTDDLSVVTDYRETIQLYNPDSGTTITVQNCVPGKVSQKTTPSDSPEGVIVFERNWNVPFKVDETNISVNVNDIVTDSQNQQWRIVSLERSERLRRFVFSTQLIDNRSRLDAWIDIVTPIYKTDDFGITSIAYYQENNTGVKVRIINVPVSSHRQLTTVPEERIEIVFCDNSIRILSQQRIRLSDGMIYKPTDLFPATQSCPCLRVIAQKEEV